MLPLPSIPWERSLPLSTLQSVLLHYITGTHLAKITNNCPIAKSDGRSSCFPFWSLWMMGPCWSFPSSQHCLVSFRLTLSPGSSPEHTMFHMASMSVFTALLLIPEMMSFPELHFSASCPIFHFFLMLQQLWVTILIPMGLTLTSQGPILSRQKHLCSLRVSLEAELSLAIFLPLNATYL